MKMNIPKKIKVGYQNREDTFTGKLAYVVYIDEKGKLRKAASWSGWRDSKIEPTDFDNVPTAGFVLNKKVGDYKSDWNHRKAHIRVYDPRGFEFEIGVENLLYILEETSSIKGKGLEGEFVYAWDDKDLVLVPVTSDDYKISTEFTEMKSMKVGKKEIKEGCIYITKDMEKVMYLGSHEIFEYNHDYESGYSTYSHASEGKKHVFVYVDKKSNSEIDYNGFPNGYWFQNGFTKLASKVSDEIDPNFAEEYDKFKQSLYGNKCKKVISNPYPIDLTKLNNNYFHEIRLIEKDNILYVVHISRNYTNTNIFNVRKESKIIIENDKVKNYSVHDGSTFYHYSNKERTYTLEQVLEHKFFSLELINDFGKTISLTK